MARERRLILLLDRLGPELAEVATSYSEAFHAAALGRFSKAVARLAGARYVRGDLDREAAPRAVLEMLTWIAMRRVGDPLPLAGGEDAARTTALALAWAALAPR